MDYGCDGFPALRTGETWQGILLAQRNPCKHWGRHLPPSLCQPLHRSSSFPLLHLHFSPQPFALLPSRFQIVPHVIFLPTFFVEEREGPPRTSAPSKRETLMTDLIYSRYFIKVSLFRGAQVCGGPSLSSTSFGLLHLPFSPIHIFFSSYSRNHLFLLLQETLVTSKFQIWREGKKSLFGVCCSLLHIRCLQTGWETSTFISYSFQTRERERKKNSRVSAFYDEEINTNSSVSSRRRKACMKYSGDGKIQECRRGGWKEGCDKNKAIKPFPRVEALRATKCPPLKCRQQKKPVIFCHFKRRWIGHWSITYYKG